jgi:hypothetical protein
MATSKTVRHISWWVVGATIMLATNTFAEFAHNIKAGDFAFLLALLVATSLTLHDLNKGRLFG